MSTHFYEPKIPWVEVAELTKILHELIYEENDIGKAREESPKLNKLLEELPADVEAIVHAEAFAIYHELRNDVDQAIAFRRLEIGLMEELLQDVEKNCYDEATVHSLLNGRNVKDLDIRKQILNSLTQK